MIQTRLEKYLNEFLQADRFKDSCPNGLQVSGRPEITKIITGVSISVELIERAIALRADAILVHHGLIWDSVQPRYSGGYKRRVQLLLGNELNLLAYHLPLDAHPVVGNNALLAGLLGLEEIAPFGEYHGQLIGMQGRIKSSAASLFELIRDKINPDSLIFDFGPELVSSVGIISGGAQRDVRQAVLKGLDCYLTGEVSENIMHYVREEGLHFVAAGHYATERFGVMALGDHLAGEFGLEVEFVDIPNPV